MSSPSRRSPSASSRRPSATSGTDIRAAPAASSASAASSSTSPASATARSASASQPSWSRSAIAPRAESSSSIAAVGGALASSRSAWLCSRSRASPVRPVRSISCARSVRSSVTTVVTSPCATASTRSACSSRASPTSGWPAGSRSRAVSTSRRARSSGSGDSSAARRCACAAEAKPALARAAWAARSSAPATASSGSAAAAASCQARRGSSGASAWATARCAARRATVSASWYEAARRSGWRKAISPGPSDTMPALSAGSSATRGRAWGSRPTEMPPMWPWRFRPTQSLPKPETSSSRGVSTAPARHDDAACSHGVSPWAVVAIDDDVDAGSDTVLVIDGDDLCRREQVASAACDGAFDEGVVRAVLRVRRARVSDALIAPDAGEPAVPRDAVQGERDRSPTPPQTLGGATEDLAVRWIVECRHRVAARPGRAASERALVAAHADLPLGALVVGG